MRAAVAAEDAWLRFRRFATRHAVRLKGRLFFGWLPGGISLGRRLVAADMALLDGRVDRDFYLAQLTAPTERAEAARDPVLHYRLVGQRFERWPRPDFDPRAHRFATPSLKRRHDPFVHALRAGWKSASGAPGEAPRPTILTLDHGRGGGSTRCLAIYEERWRAGTMPGGPGEPRRVLRLERVPGPVPLFSARDPGGAILYSGDPFAAPEKFLDFLRAQGIERLVVNHLIDLPEAAFEAVPDLATRAGIPFEAVAHDYFHACPRVNLVDARDRHCGLPDATVCRACVAAGGSDAGPVDPVAWRAASAAYLAAAERVIAPSEDLAHRLAGVFPAARYAVVPPEAEGVAPPLHAPARRPGEPLRVLVIGALSVPKGYFVVWRLAWAIRWRRLPIRITVLGRAPWPASLQVAGVSVRGRYREEDLAGLIEEAAPHLMFFPAIWPETWSFTLSTALARGLPVAAFDLGAIGARLTALGRPRLDPALADRPGELAAALLAAAPAKS